MSDIFDTRSWPYWLVAVAVRVDELVAQPATMDRFRRMLRDWKAEHESQGPTSPVDKRGHILYNTVEILPRRRLSLAAKYAVLAAIHDGICEKTRRIDPWTTHKRTRNIGFPKAIAGTSYMVLESDVSGITDEHRERIECSLDDVVSDLRTAIASEAPAITTKQDTALRGEMPPVREAEDAKRGDIPDKASVITTPSPPEGTEERQGETRQPSKTNADQEILDKIPPLPPNEDDRVRQGWKTNVAYAKDEHIIIGTARNARYKGIRADDMSKGVDERNVQWRRDPEDVRAIWYYSPSTSGECNS